MLNTGNTQINGLVEELQAHIQLLSERAADAAGKLVVANEEIVSLKAKIADLEKPAA